MLQRRIWFYPELTGLAAYVMCRDPRWRFPVV